MPITLSGRASAESVLNRIRDVGGREQDFLVQDNHDSHQTPE